MTSTEPATMLSTPGSSLVPSVLSTERAKVRAVMGSLRETRGPRPERPGRFPPITSARNTAR